MNLKKALLKVFSANFFQTISSAIVGLVIPAILSIEAFANYKTYTLIVSYLGILSLGFADGLYIKYGGKDYSKINRNIFANEFYSFLLLETVIFIIVLLVSVLLNNTILILVSITIVPFMITSFFKTIYQATGSFSRYSKIMFIYSLSYAFLNIVTALFFRVDNFIIYCIVSIASNTLSSLYCLALLKKDHANNKINLNINSKYFSSIKVGFFILLGNLAFLLFFGLDRWTVKLFMDTNSFAYYSFAVSLLNIVIVLINSISITFYSYLFEKKNMDRINEIKDLLILIGGYASIVSFGLRIIVNLFLKKYIPSLDIISNTFATFPYMIIINSLYVNIYKIQKKEKKYFFVIIIMLTISLLYNLIALILFNSTYAISIATLLAFITWFVFSLFDLKSIKLSVQNVITLSLLTFSFLIFSHINNLFLGLLLYGLTLLLVSIIFYRDKVYLIRQVIKSK